MAIYVGETLNFKSQVILSNLGNGPLHDGFIDDSKLYIFGDKVVCFYFRSVSTPKSAFCVAVIDSNSNYTYYSSQIYNNLNHVYSAIYPLGNGIFLVFCGDGTVYKLNLSNATLNNSVPITIYPSENLSTPCGMAQPTSFQSNDKNYSTYWAIPNSQNGGYIYNAIYDKKLNLISGGLQGTYQGPTQTYYSLSLPNLTAIANTNFNQSNGIQTSMAYSGSDYYSVKTLYDIHQGFSSCGPLSPGLPSPGNWSGAYCAGQGQGVEFLYNGNFGFNNFFDTDILGCVGGYNIDSYPNMVTANVCLIQNENYCFFPVNYRLRYNSFCFGSKIAAGSLIGSPGYVIILSTASGQYNLPFPANANRYSFNLQNQSRPVSALGVYKS